MNGIKIDRWSNMYYFVWFDCIPAQIILHSNCTGNIFPVRKYTPVDTEHTSLQVLSCNLVECGVYVAVWGQLMRTSAPHGRYVMVLDKVETSGFLESKGPFNVKITFPDTEIPIIKTTWSCDYLTLIVGAPLLKRHTFMLKLVAVSCLSFQVQGYP